MNSVNTCFKQNYFIFNNEYFVQEDGLPMGSALSPLLAEIVMDNFELNIFNSINLSSCIRFWTRYLDDVQMIWTGSERQLNLFLNTVNSLNKNIQFTMEIDGDCINFLDLTIFITNNQLCFSLSPFPTYLTSIYISKDYSKTEFLLTLKIKLA